MRETLEGHSLKLAATELWFACIGFVNPRDNELAAVFGGQFIIATRLNREHEVLTDLPVVERMLEPELFVIAERRAGYVRSECWVVVLECSAVALAVVEQRMIAADRLAAAKMEVHLVLNSIRDIKVVIIPVQDDRSRREPDCNVALLASAQTRPAGEIDVLDALVENELARVVAVVNNDEFSIPGCVLSQKIMNGRHHEPLAIAGWHDAGDVRLNLHMIAQIEPCPTFQPCGRFGMP